MIPKSRDKFRILLGISLSALAAALLVVMPRSGSAGFAGSPVSVVGAQLLERLGMEKVAADTEHGISEFRIKSNGLSVLLAERHAAPVVTVMMLYRVGSRNEAVGYTGATHFLEHMMFKGSTNFDPLKHTGIDDVLKPIGGTNNATTWFDRTAYYEVIPRQYLDLALNFEADRMRHLLLRSSDRASEMTVVRNELERDANDPRNVLEVQLFATAYQEHPYHHPTIGWRSDVEGVPLERLRQFHEDFYWPNNATLMIIGDFDPAAALKMVAARLGSIPRSPKPIPKVYTVEPPQQGERRFVVQRGDDLPRIDVAFHTCRAADKDIYPLAVIETLLGDNSRRSSRLYGALIDNGLASETYADNYELRDPGLFMISAADTPNTKPAALESAILSELEKLKDRPISADELSRAKMLISKKQKLATIDPLGMAEQIGEAVAAADWKFWSSYSHRIDAVTADDITRVARQYFQNNNRTVGYYLPRVHEASPASQQSNSAAQQNVTGAPEHYRQGENAMAVARDARGITATTSVLPESSLAPRMKRKVLANGLTVVVLPIPGTGTIGITGKIRAGDYFAPEDKDLVPTLLSDLLTKGSKNYSKSQLADLLDSMGTSLDFEAGSFWVEFTSNIVNTDLANSLPVLSDVLQKPVLSDEELEKTKKIVDSELREHVVESREVARNSLAHSLYKPGVVYYEKTFKAKLEEVPAINTQDLRSFHERQLIPANTVLAIIGDVNPEQAFAIAEKSFGSWDGSAKATPITLPAVSQPAAAEKIPVELADKENVDISIGHPASVNLKSADYFAAMIANAALGHSPFATRLAPIREKYGLTYDIYSVFMDPAYGGGPWVIECSTNPKNVDRVLGLIHQIVGDYVRSGITPDEVQLEAKHLSGEFLVSLRNPDDIGKYVTEYEMLGLGLERIDQFSEHLGAVTLKQANDAIKKYFGLDRAITTIAGTLKK